MSTFASTEQILSELRRIVADVVCVDANDVSPDSRIVLDLGAESIDLLDLRFRIERAFGLRITNEELAALVGPDVTRERFQQQFTVRAVGEYVAGRIGLA
jgi:acyl carrier protein